MIELLCAPAMVLATSYLLTHQVRIFSKVQKGQQTPSRIRLDYFKTAPFAFQSCEINRTNSSFPILHALQPKP